MSIYYSRRTKAARETWKESDIQRVDLGGQVAALVPLALFADDQGTLPHAASPVKAQPPIPAAAFSADDRATRIAGVAIAWNVFRHFYGLFHQAEGPVSSSRRTVRPFRIVSMADCQKREARLEARS